jgi:1-acyl-sn-glycerol-3-phosphate acyltransferase
MGFVYLSRSWNNDAQNLKKMFSGIKNVAEPFWLVSHPEGTRLTPSKLADCNEFARSKGLAETKVLMNTLVIISQTCNLIGTIYCE